MPKLINALKTLSVILLATNLLAAQEADSSKKAYLSYKKKSYLKGSLKSDSIKGFIAAEYCLNHDAKYEPEKTNEITECNSTVIECCSNPDTYYKGWILLNYEQFIPLTVKVQTESFSDAIYLGASLDADIKFTYWFGGGVSGSFGRCNRDKWCEYISKIDEEHNIYDIFDTLYIDERLQNIDTAKISTLFDKVFPVKWYTNHDMDNQPLNISGSYNIKISGFCTKEQLKKIEKDKKNKKKNRE